MEVSCQLHALATLSPGEELQYPLDRMLGGHIPSILSLRVFENRVLMKIFGQKKDEVTGGWRKLHNERLHNLHSSPSIIRIIKSRRMRQAGHVA
jgi:hypothetical protein